MFIAFLVMCFPLKIYTSNIYPSWISLNSESVFTIRQRLVVRKPRPTLLLTQWIFNLWRHIDMISEELAFDDTVHSSIYTAVEIQIGRAEVVAWGIEPLTFRLGVQLWREKKVRHSNHSAIA